MNYVIRICICMICVWLCVCVRWFIIDIHWHSLTMYIYVWLGMFENWKEKDISTHVNPYPTVLFTARLRMFTFVCRVWLHKANRKLLLAHLPPLASFHSFQWEKNSRPGTVCWCYHHSNILGIITTEYHLDIPMIFMIIYDYYPPLGIPQHIPNLSTWGFEVERSVDWLNPSRWCSACLMDEVSKQPEQRISVEPQIFKSRKRRPFNPRLCSSWLRSLMHCLNRTRMIPFQTRDPHKPRSSSHRGLRTGRCWGERPCLKPCHKPCSKMEGCFKIGVPLVAPSPSFLVEKYKAWGTTTFRQSHMLSNNRVCHKTSQNCLPTRRCFCNLHAF